MREMFLAEKLPVARSILLRTVLSASVDRGRALERDQAEPLGVAKTSVSPQRGSAACIRAQSDGQIAAVC